MSEEPLIHQSLLIPYIWHTCQISSPTSKSSILQEQDREQVYFKDRTKEIQGIRRVLQQRLGRRTLASQGQHRAPVGQRFQKDWVTDPTDSFLGEKYCGSYIGIQIGSHICPIYRACCFSIPCGYRCFLHWSSTGPKWKVLGTKICGQRSPQA